MADYRDLAAALGGGYGQDTGGITPDTLATLRNGKKASVSDLLGMLKAIGSGSLSNLESLVRGGVAQIPGTAGDLEGLARMGINKAFGAGGVNVNPTPVLPTTTDILGMMPRVTAKRPETTGMEELGGYMAPAFGKVAKPAVMATGRLAGQEINAAMTGQPTRSLLGTITPKPLQLDVYHGTPHTLPPTERNPLGEFDASKIGTGEGAQAYGYGIYTAEAPAVAKGYRDTLAYKAFDLQPEAERLGLNLPAGTRGEFMRQVQANKPPEVLARQLQNANIAARDLPQDKLTELFRAYQEKGGGNLYKVDLPDEKIATMIDWDKPLSQQSAQVKEALKGIEQDLPTIPNFDLKKWMDSDPLASTWHNAIVRDLKVEPSKISELLQNKGVAGIKYFDELSRRPGVTSMTQAQLDTRIDILKKDIDSGLGNQDRMKQILSALEQERASHRNLTRNFVVFPGEEKNMTILERNAEKSAK
jgi:hypothetical protein